MGVRQFLNQRPQAGWAVAGVLLLVAVFFVWRSISGPAGGYSLEHATQEITIKDRETGEEWKIPRGRMEAMLMERTDLDPNVGLPNPNTGKLTGFPKNDWESTVERIKTDRKVFAEAYGGRIPSSGAAPKKTAK